MLFPSDRSPVHERRQRAERARGRRDDHVRVDTLFSRLIAFWTFVPPSRLVRLVVDDLAAELLQAGLERRGDVLEVDDDGVGRDRGLPPALLPRELGHRGAFVLRDVAEAEGELALRAEALRPHLVGADARGDREDAAVDRLLHDRRGEVDVARREHDVRALAEQLRGARLRDRRLVALRVAGLDLQRPAADAALRVDLLDAHLRRRERRPVERRHRALRVERPADHDRRRRRACAPPRSRRARAPRRRP